MALLPTVVLATALMTIASSTVALHPGDVVIAVVTDTDSRPLPGVSVQLREATTQPRSASSQAPVQLLTDSDGRARFLLPPEGRYTLTLEMSGFLSTQFGPFVVCPASQSSCGPSLVTPLRVTLPPAALVHGADVR